MCYICGGQRTAFCSQFCPGVEPRPLDLAKRLHLLSLLTGPYVALCQRILPFFDNLGACSTSQPRPLWDVVFRRNWLAVNYEEAFQM